LKSSRCILFFHLRRNTIGEANPNPSGKIRTEWQGGEGIPDAIVDDPSSFTIRAFVGNTSASDLTVGTVK